MNERKYLANVRFLIVDDNAFCRTMVRHILNALGVSEIYDATNGRDALQTLEACEPDILLIDWEMPGLNGIEMTKTIRSCERGTVRFLPVIMISSHSEYWRIQKARNVGVNEFLVKPFSPKGLFSRIRAVVERPRVFISAGKYFGPDRRRHDLDHEVERRKGHSTPSPTETVANPKQILGQAQINAIFNPGSSHPDDQSPPAG